MLPVFFPNTTEFRNWLEENHQSEKELFVGYYKVSTKKPTMSWSDSVDEALCFGWIDGIRKGIDSERYCIRFTPRNPKSVWSKVNIKKVGELTRQGKMQPAGLAIFEKRTDSRSEIYSYETLSEKLATEMATQFQENQQAWNFFTSQPPSYRKTRIYWVMSAKQVSTKNTRLCRLIEACEAGKRLF